MTQEQAQEKTASLNMHRHLYAEVVRILPEHVDPITEGDHGWDVKVTVIYKG
jgi:hypothetical protein